MELRELQEKLAGRKALEAELESLSQQRTELENRLKREKINLEFEESDVEALKGNTLKSFFYSAIGKKEERLMKEEDEAEEAKQQCENTLAELEGVNARIKRIEIELRGLKSAKRKYEDLVKSLSQQIKELEPLLSDDDAVALETIQRELAEQEQKRAYFAEITEAGKTLKRSISSVAEALQEMMTESKYGSIFSEYERRNEAEERRRIVLIQKQRFCELLAKGVKFDNDYIVDMESVDNMFRKALVASNQRYDGPAIYDILSEAPDMILNLDGILNELEKKSERSKSFQAELERRLSDLIQKYQTT